VSEALSSLIDQHGRRIPRAEIAALREEISPVGAIHARPPFEGHFAFGMDPARLGAFIRAADTGNTLNWMILAEEIEELFPHYYAVLSKRRRQVSQLPITVNDAADNPQAKKHGDLVRDWLKTDVLQQSLFGMLDAIGKGYSVHEIIWESTPRRVRPAQLLYRPPRFFELSWVDGATVWLRTENGFQDLMPHKFIVHRHPSKSGLIARSGLTRAVAFLWLYATYTAKDWAVFCQGYGMPIRVGRYGPEASETDKHVLWQAVSSIAGDVAAIIPKSMEIEFVKGNEGTAGTELYLKRADWLDRQVSKLVLGSTAGTDAIAGGHAVGKEHREVEQDVENFDAGLLAFTLTRQVIPAMVAFTHGPQDEYPTLTIGRPDLVPLPDLISAIKEWGPMGMKVKAQQLLERLQLEEPEDGDEIVGGVPAHMLERVDVPAAPTTGDVDIPDNDTTDRDGQRRPRVNKPPPGPVRNTFLGRLISLHAQADPEILEALTERLGQEAAGALAGLTDQVRQAFEQATDLRDLAHRVHALKLKPAAFAEAMARGMALAQLVGQANLVEELGTHARLERMVALTAAERDALSDDDFAVPAKRELPIKDRNHVKAAWDLVDTTKDLTEAERGEARRRILARAKALGIDTSGWEGAAT
jgi:phage gp29-like protein